MVVGVKDKKIQECLLDERTLTLQKANEIAVSMESASKYSKLMLGTQISETETTIHGLPKRCECYHCGSTTQLADKYQFKNKECFKCRWIGLTRQKCRQEEDRPASTTAHNGKRRTVNNMNENYIEESEVNMEKLDLHTIAVLQTPPVLMEILINKKNGTHV